MYKNSTSSINVQILSHKLVCILSYLCSPTHQLPKKNISFPTNPIKSNFLFHPYYRLHVPWVDKNDVVKTHWFLGGGVFLENGFEGIKCMSKALKHIIPKTIIPCSHF